MSNDYVRKSKNDFLMQCVNADIGARIPVNSYLEYEVANRLTHPDRKPKEFRLEQTISNTYVVRIGGSLSTEGEGPFKTASPRAESAPSEPELSV